ncbi:Protein of unknown function [Colwellia chukchiensis]|uniref:DUF3833 domain-containing protein n=1 Tax=Colwellia chukchiensis TaxID=641665 RepID=A0A1H7SVJ7_9GAMM|nr:DUF3833 domain-containing protein [Colwellia chukchiensis]SEL76613.1 Protein of unknown function [Colwellia chukchiensis]
MKCLEKLSIAIMLVLLLSSCTVGLQDYRQTAPKLDIKQYFSGKLIAWGMVQDYRDNVIRRFCVELDGQWQGEQGLLKEVFYFNDGEISYRNWHLTKLADGQYQGSAEDVVGQAQGQQMGFAFQWQYQLNIATDGTSMLFSLDDWMYQVDEYRLFNRTKMKKLGIIVAEITLFFDKEFPQKRCHQAGEISHLMGEIH